MICQLDILADVMAGNVICDIGQVDAETRRTLTKMERRGIVLRWRGYWHPVPGAQHGIGPLKTCWGLASVYGKAA